MNREDLIELGAVSVDTKGGDFSVLDTDGGLSQPIGLSDD
jgi:hypothetical protein